MGCHRQHREGSAAFVVSSRNTQNPGTSSINSQEAAGEDRVSVTQLWPAIFHLKSGLSFQINKLEVPVPFGKFSRGRKNVIL